MNDTANFIEGVLTEHFDYINRDFFTLDEDEFEKCFGDYPQGRYGWTFPDIGAFCPDRIARQIGHLDDEDRLDYIRAILWMIDRHVVLFHEDPDRSAMDRHRAIESELYELAPNSMVLLSAVEMNALDNT